MPLIQWSIKDIWENHIIFREKTDQLMELAKRLDGTVNVIHDSFVSIIPKQHREEFTKQAAALLEAK